MRRLLAKLHLWLSLPAGILISIICLSGAVLVFEQEITQAVRPELYQRQPQPAGEGAPQVGKKQKRPSLPFFQTMRKVHRWLLDPPARKGEKSVGKVVVGVSTLAMVVILVSGLVMWWPRTRRALRHRLTVAADKGRRRFWYDMHVSVGFYATLLLLLMALTGLTWSFGWCREAASWLLGGGPELKRLLYSLHTGSWGGLTTKMLYFVASLVGALLPWTGYYLWWKKRRQRHPGR